MFHTGEKPNQCSHCEKAFISKGVLHQHMITHTEEKSYHCSHFEKTLHKSKLDRHMIQHKEKHTGEKTYYFNQCEESISENDKFTENIMTHTGDDPYQCDLCEKAFPRKHI